MGLPKLVATLSLTRSPCSFMRTSWQFPPASSLTNRWLSSSHSIQAGEVGRRGVRSRGWPPAAETIHTSPPVEPWSLINPPIKAIAFPSGDHRGTAICNPCSGPATSAGARIALGVAVQRLRIQLRNPPVVLSRRIGSHIGQPLRIRRQSNSYTCRLAGVSQHRRMSGFAALQLAPRQPAESPPRPRQSPRTAASAPPAPQPAASRPPHIRTPPASIRRKSRRFHIPLQLGQPPRRLPVQPRKIQIRLLARLRAIGKESQRLRIRRPDHLPLMAMLLRLGCRRHPLALLQIVQRSHPNLHPTAVHARSTPAACRPAQSPPGQSGARGSAHSEPLRSEPDPERNPKQKPPTCAPAMEQ